MATTAASMGWQVAIFFTFYGLNLAKGLGIRMCACNTTLNVMGVSKEDLIDGVEFAGAPAFLDFAGESDVQLFI